MSLTFTKLFSSITESTVWCEPAHTRLVWITMLAMADKKGRVWASVPGLANRARVPTEDCRKALETFMAPDRDSRTKEDDGRRIEEIDGGWRLLNYSKYRDIRDEEDRQEYKRLWDRNNRGKNSDKIRQNPTESDPERHNAEAEAEAEAEVLTPLSGKPDVPPGFDRFWKTWPASQRKVAKSKCMAVWKRKGLEAKADAVVAHVEVLAASEGWKTGFDPMPLTYLNQERWDGADLTAPAGVDYGQCTWNLNGTRGEGGQCKARASGVHKGNGMARCEHHMARN